MPSACQGRLGSPEASRLVRVKPLPACSAAISVTLPEGATSVVPVRFTLRLEPLLGGSLP